MAVLDFRDGRREVPDHVADILRRHESSLYRITYDEALALVNKTLLQDVVDKKLSSVITAHFGANRT